MSTIEARIKELEDEFYLLSEELHLLKRRTDRRSGDLEERIAAKSKEIKQLLTEIQKMEGKNL